MPMDQTFQFHFDHPEHDRDIPIQDVQRFIEAIQRRYAELRDIPDEETRS